MHGRVLREALTDGDSVTWQTQTYRAERPVSGGTYRQYITVYRVESTTYVGEGNGIIEVE
ncbi:MAG: hypothetical protein OXH22_04760 [Chloroflexi bacterium]|nr:hypothetical protein [Chloroflexota bacterium]